eukprot:9116166-Alexandrium_andersonii.AAC.1
MRPPGPAAGSSHALCNIASGVQSLNCADPGTASHFYPARARPGGSVPLFVLHRMVRMRQDTSGAPAG